VVLPLLPSQEREREGKGGGGDGGGNKKKQKTQKMEQNLSAATTTRKTEKENNVKKGLLSDELGYASGDGQHQITVDFALFVYSRHEKENNLQSRAKRLSSSRESVHTYAI